MDYPQTKNVDIQHYSSNINNKIDSSNFASNIMTYNKPGSNNFLENLKIPIKKQIKFSVQNKPIYNRFDQNNVEKQRNQCAFLTPTNYNKLFRSKKPSQNGKQYPLLHNKFNKVRYTKKSPNQVELIFKYNQDDNGLFSFLGTKGNQEEYKNPFKRKELSVFMSSLEYGDYSNFVDKSESECLTKNEINSFMGIDLGNSR
jgi:hypothetical protein